MQQNPFVCPYPFNPFKIIKLKNKLNNRNNISIFLEISFKETK